MPLKDRICKHINGWLSKNLSWAGMEVLVKAVAQAIPAYALSGFKLPDSFTHSIQSSICNYWWGHENGNGKFIGYRQINFGKVSFWEGLVSRTSKRST